MRAFLFGFGLLLAAAQPALAAPAWSCLPGIKLPVAVVAGEVVCASENGRDCLWGQCPGTNKAAQAWKPKAEPKDPLACGADHQAKHGSDGYSQADHWCAQACAASPSCKLNWQCLPGIKTPVRLAAGNVECAAKNGADCLWGACAGSNKQAAAWKAPADLKPLSCGADHQAKHGSTGYAQADHWCRQACDAWKCGK